MESADEEVGNEDNSPAVDGDWKPFASFVVEFQARQVRGQVDELRTMAHHMEADADTSWAGIESEQLCQWMLEQAGEKVRQEPEGEDLIRAEPADVRPTTGPSAEVKITQVRIFQPLQAEKSVGTIETDEPFRGIVRGDEPFAFEVSFELAGEAATEVAKREIKYEVRSSTPTIDPRQRRRRPSYPWVTRSPIPWLRVNASTPSRCLRLLYIGGCTACGSSWP
jgi:hypothetical protein